MIYTLLQGWTQVQLTLSEAEDIFIPANLSVRSFHLSVTLSSGFGFFSELNYQQVRSRMEWQCQLAETNVELLSFIV